MCPSPSEVNQTLPEFQLLKDQASRNSGRAIADDLFWVNDPAWCSATRGAALMHPQAPGTGSCFTGRQMWPTLGCKEQIETTITLQSSNIDQWEGVWVNKWLQKMSFLPVLLHFGVLWPSAALCPAASLHSSHGLCQASDTKVARGGCPAGEEPPIHAIHYFFLLHFILVFLLHWQL